MSSYIVPMAATAQPQSKEPTNIPTSKVSPSTTQASAVTADNLLANHGWPWPDRPRVQDLTQTKDVKPLQRIVLPELNVPVGEVYHGRKKTLSFSVRISDLIFAILKDQMLNNVNLKLVGGFEYARQKSLRGYRKLTRNRAPRLQAVKVECDKKRIDGVAYIQLPECVLELEEDIVLDMFGEGVTIRAAAAAKLLETARLWVDRDHWVLDDFRYLSSVPQQWYSRPLSLSQSPSADASDCPIQEENPLRKVSTYSDGDDAGFKTAIPSQHSEEEISDDEMIEKELAGPLARQFDAETEDQDPQTNILLPYIMNGGWIWITKVTAVPHTTYNLDSKNRVQQDAGARLKVDIDRTLTEQLYNARMAWFSLKSQDPKAALRSFCKDRYVPPRSLDGVPDRLCLIFLYNRHNSEILEPFRKRLARTMQKYWIVHSKEIEDLEEMLLTQSSPADSTLFSPFKKTEKARIDPEIVRMARRYVDIEKADLAIWIAENRFCSKDCPQQNFKERRRCLAKKQAVERKIAIWIMLRMAIRRYAKEKSSHSPHCHPCFWRGSTSICEMHDEAKETKKITPFCQRCWDILKTEERERVKGDQMTIKVIRWDQNHQSMPRPENWCCHAGGICINECEEIHKWKECEGVCTYRHTRRVPEIGMVHQRDPTYRMISISPRGVIRPTDSFCQVDSGIGGVEEEGKRKGSHSSGSGKVRKKRSFIERIGRIMKRPSWTRRRSRSRSEEMSPEEPEIENATQPLIDVHQQFEALGT